MLRIAGIIPFPSHAIAKLQPDTMVNIPKITEMVYDGMSFNVNLILGLKAALPRTYLGGYFFRIEPSLALRKEHTNDDMSRTASWTHRAQQCSAKSMIYILHIA